MHAVAESVDTPYFIWLDEDVQFLTPGWLGLLLEHFQDPTIGMVTCMQVKDQHMVEATLQHANEVCGGSVEMSWAPGHVFAIRTLLLRNGVNADRKMPGVKGMSDVDICLQVRNKGFSVVNDERVVVWHPHKPQDDIGRRADQQPTLAEERAVFEAQKNYMIEKWGNFYPDAMRSNVLQDNRKFE
jgi:hypothetical protein